MKYSTIIVIGSGIVLSFVIGVAYFKQVHTSVPFNAQYPEKKVYTTDLSVDTAPLIEDCDGLGGTFNTCGSPCAPDAEACMAVCAYTCDL